jgi:hypothetical protein
MQLLHLYDTEETYVGDPVFFRPYGEVEGTGYGRAEGTVTGDRLSGNIQWANQPRLREDDVWCPNLIGRIDTDDGADILLRMAGYSVRRADEDGRDITASCRFTTADSAYAWLNTVIGLVEGHIDADGHGIRMSVYECVHELDPA